MFEQGLHHRAPSTATRASEALPGADRHQAAARCSTEAPVLHDLGAPAARRPLRRAAGVRGRPDGQDDARPRPAEGGRAGGQRATCPTRRARRAALVAIDNETGEVRAMVGGARLRARAPFNLATQGQRQPGSAFKPFMLAEALQQRHRAGLACGRRASASSTCPARRQREVRRQQLRGRLRRHARRSARATTVLRQLRLRRGRASRSGTKRIAALARADGHPHAGLARTPR